jgi:uncharacterized protein
MKKRLALVGFGAAGLFFLEELAGVDDLEVHLFDVGPPYESRYPCPIDQGKLKVCPPNRCSYCAPAQSGGIFNDYKVGKNASRVIGGNLYDLIGEQELQGHLDAVHRIIADHAPCEIPIASPSEDDLAWITARAEAAGMEYHKYVLIHCGSDNAVKINAAILQTICRRSKNLVFHWNTQVVSLSRQGSQFLVRYVKNRGKTELDQEQEARFDIAVVAVGRGGTRWLSEQEFWPALDIQPGQADIGVRVEVPLSVTAEIDRFYETKFTLQTSVGEARHFCSNPRGFVVVEHHGLYVLVNGHAKTDEHSLNNNFAVLSKSPSIKDPHLYSQAVAQRVNSLAGGGPLVQRFGDLLAGRPTESLNGNRVRPTLQAKCGNLVPGYPDRLVGVVEYLLALDRICPGIADNDTLIFGPECKTRPGLVDLTKEMETTIPNLHLTGDGCGWTRSVAHASVSGRLAAKGVRRKLAP